MSSKSKQIFYASPGETDDMTRKILIWLSAYPDLPVDIIRPEPMLDAENTGMELTVIQSYITNQYITGGHRGEYQFGIFYRCKPNGADARLKALQTLNRLGDYAVSTEPELGNGVHFIKCEVTSGAKLYAPYENGDEDYQILIKITYEVL